MKRTTIIIPALLLGLLPQVASANDGNWSKDWSSTIKNLGKIYKNKENPIIQEIKAEGRIHYQATHIDGDALGGVNISDDSDNYRRLRFGTKIKFLNYFKAKIVYNLVSDNRYRGGDLDFGYANYDNFLITLDAKKLFGLDGLDEFGVTYGRHKFELSEEVYMSSNNIRTIERSPIANQVYQSGRVTGLSTSIAKDQFEVFAAIFTSDDDSDFLAGPTSDGYIYNVAVNYAHSDVLRFRFDAVYNDVQGGENDELGYDWATTFNAVYEEGPMGILGSVIIGDNGSQGGGTRGGSFHGLVIQPWYWVIEDKLQAVASYSYSGSSESEGIRMNSRYLRTANEGTAPTNSGRGDTLHNLYVGVNYFLSGNNAKLMGGIEYQTLDTPGGDVDGLTYLIAARLKF